jgi:mannose-6-phosphate isomerase-like protein (cupin superfamily)
VTIVACRVERPTALSDRSCLTIAVVQSWDLTQIEATEGTRSPTVLETVDGARAIVIRLAPGQELGDHQVRERAWLTIVEGKARIEAGTDTVDAGPGMLLTFEPGERHSVRSENGAQIILLLSPWPGEGHYPDGQEPASK